MSWNPEILSQGEIHALREAAERSWGDDTRESVYAGHSNPSLGQCYNTSRWLQERLGGHVGRKDGHYFWVSPDLSHVLDLTGDQFGGSPMLFKQASHPQFRDLEVLDHPIDDEGTHRMINRANREFDTLGTVASKLALDYAGDGLPGEEPQAQADIENRYWHHDPGYDEPVGGEYKFVYTNGHVEISPFHDHEDLANQAGIDLRSTDPMAVGYVNVDQGLANWSVSSNIAAKLIAKELKDYTKHVGWQWGGMTDLGGEPVGTGSEFAPKSTFFRFQGGHLLIGPRDADIVRISAQNCDSGTEALEGRLKKAIFGRALMLPSEIKIVSVSAGPEVFFTTREAHRDLEDMTDALREWASDQGLRLVSLNDNLIRNKEDLELENIYTPNPNQKDRQFFPSDETNQSVDRQQGGMYRCPHCEQLFPTWHLYVQHRHNEEPLGDDPLQDGKLPETQMDQEQGALPNFHFTPQQPAGAEGGSF